MRRVIRAAGILVAMSAGAGQVRLSAVIGAMSYALDVTEGEPPGHAIRACKIGMRLAEAIGLDAATPLGPLLRAAAQGRRLLGQLGADGGAVRRRRPPRQADLQARRLVGQAAGVRVVAAHGRARRHACAPASTGCWRSRPRARSPGR